MNDTSSQLNFDETDEVEPLTATAVAWIARSYESMEHWKRKGEELFLSLNGQSDVARNRLASILRKHFLESKLSAEEVTRWKARSVEKHTSRVTPPKVSASNSAYVDWCYIADYVLLGCASTSDAMETENQNRLSEYRQCLDSYNIRLAVYDARTIIRENKGIDDSEVLTRLQEKHDKAAAAHVKEARRLERNKCRYAPPQKPTESPGIPCYIPLYF